MHFYLPLPAPVVVATAAITIPSLCASSLHSEVLGWGRRLEWHLVGEFESRSSNPIGWVQPAAPPLVEWHWADYMFTVVLFALLEVGWAEMGSCQLGPHLPRHDEAKGLFT